MPKFNSDVSKYGIIQPTYAPDALIEQANTEYTIQDALKLIGYTSPEGEYFSVKIYCPWHYEHADPMDKNCRIFGTTNIYCFAMHGLVYPVDVIVRARDISRKQAAEYLLDARGLLKAKNYRERWRNISEQDTSEQVGDLSYVIKALQTRLENVPGYAKQEYKSGVRKAWSYCLAKLNSMEEVDYERLSKWLTASEQVIVSVLAKEDND